MVIIRPFPKVGIRTIHLFIFLAFTLLSCPTWAQDSEGQQIDKSLTYQARGDRYEGVYTKPSAFSLIAAQAYNSQNNENEVLPTRLKVRFFLNQPIEASINVRDLSFNPRYLMNAKQITDWQAQEYNEFVWPATDVITHLDFIHKLSDLAVVIILGSQEHKDERRRQADRSSIPATLVAPAILYSAVLPPQIDTYSFVFNVGSQKVNFRLYKLEALTVSVKDGQLIVHRQDRYSRDRTTASWDKTYRNQCALLRWGQAGNWPDGWYSLVAVDPQTRKVMYRYIFYHRRYTSTEEFMKEQFANYKASMQRIRDDYQARLRDLKVYELSSITPQRKVSYQPAFLTRGLVLRAYDADEVEGLLESTRTSQIHALRAKAFSGMRDYVLRKFPETHFAATFSHPQFPDVRFVDKGIADKVIKTITDLINLMSSIPSLDVNIEVNSVPEPQAKVELVNAGGVVVKNTFTNEVLHNVHRGSEYKIRVTKPDYQPIEKTGVDLMLLPENVTLTCWLFRANDHRHVAHCKGID